MYAEINLNFEIHSNCRTQSEINDITNGLFSYGKPYSLGITKALSQLWEQDFLQSSFCQLMTTVTAPNIHCNCIAVGTRTSFVCAA